MVITKKRVSDIIKYEDINKWRKDDIITLTAGTGVGKSYPLLRSHNVLNNLHQSYLRAPVVMFFPGTYNEQELILFNEIKDDNYYSTGIKTCQGDTKNDHRQTGTRHHLPSDHR